MTNLPVVDLFAGAGGWDIAARTLGLDPLGVELDARACETRARAGLRTIRADVKRLPIVGTIGGLIASPPCQDFSSAGKRAGISGARGQLMLSVVATARALQPRWVACEQVPEALPIWAEQATELAELGYATWVGLLNAADFGVPQSRVRAFLLASRDHQPKPPSPTHAANPSADLFGNDPKPWVTMAAALGWGDGWVLDRRQTGALLVDTQRRPAPTVTGTAFGRGVWRVTHAVTGQRRKLTMADALTLQGFPPDWPLSGTMASQGLQVGNAVPPALAAAVLAELATP